MAFIWLNGAFVDDEDQSASVSVRDSGFLHAAGVFTTMLAARGRVFQLDAHLRRLRNSCEALSTPLTHTDEKLTAVTAELLERNELADARLRLTVTRGKIIRDPSQGMMLSPTVLLTAAAVEPYPAEYYEGGMTVRLFDSQKLNPYDIQAGHKTLNYLSRLTALREANRLGAGEALWFDVHNFLQSGSVSNVFIVKGGAILTPPTTEELRDPEVKKSTPIPRSAVLPGVTRRVVAESAKEMSVDFRPAALDVNQLLDADEVFLTNSVMGVMPVRRIERKPIGDDKPGELTRRIMQAYQERLNGQV